MDNEIKNTKAFWDMIDKMISSNELVIDRPKGSKHPTWKWVYEIDYGYLKGTTSADGEGIDVYVGSNKNKTATAIICIVDEIQQDSEIKILIDCNEDEINYAYSIHNKFDSIKGILIRR